MDDIETWLQDWTGEWDVLLPVGGYEAILEKLRAALSARQQVGQEPFGYIRRAAIRALREDDEVSGVFVHAYPPTDSVPVYLDPPEQAVPDCGYCDPENGRDYQSGRMAVEVAANPWNAVPAEQRGAVSAWANPDDPEDVIGLGRLRTLRENNGAPGKVLAAKYVRPLYAAAPARVVPAWQPIETAPISGSGLLYWARSGHIEDASFHQNEDGTWGYTLFDGETLNDSPTYWMPTPGAKEVGCG